MNAQSNALERAFAKSGMPYRIVGGLRFYERKEIKDILAYLSVIENPGDSLRLFRVINEPKRGIGGSTVDTVLDIAQNIGETPYYVVCHADEYAPLSRKAAPLLEFGRMMEGLRAYYGEYGLDGLLDVLFERTGYMRFLEAQGFEGITRIENITELKSNILKYTQENEEASLGGFLEEIALYTDIDNYDQGADAIALMTVHAAKGLEFDNVFIAGMEEGIFPGRASTMRPDEIEEERRLAYVAITRAKRELTILSAERRTLFGQTAYGRPSRFLGEIPVELTQQQNLTAAKQPPAVKIPAKTANIHKTGNIGAAPTAQINFADGDLVRHKVFGEGVVLSSRQMGGDILIEVNFGGGFGIKKLMANFARLEKAQP